MGAFSMIDRRAVLGSWLAVLASLIVQAAALAEERVVVLRNGRVLTGEVLSLGDMTLVSLGDRGEVQLPNATVEMVCQNLEQAYQRKRAAIAYGDLASHLELALWCLKNGLPARAADQWLVVYSIQPNHPGLEPALRTLELAVAATPAGLAHASAFEPASRRQAGTGLADAADSASAGPLDPSRSRPAQASFLPGQSSSHSGVAPARFVEPIRHATTDSGRQPGAGETNAEQRDSAGGMATGDEQSDSASRTVLSGTELIASQTAAGGPDVVRSVDVRSSQSAHPSDQIGRLPTGVVEQFTREVQPYLLNRCGTNACHGADRGTDSQTGVRLLLARPRIGEARSKRRTEQNLASVLQFVDRQAPEQSVLLSVPASAHGGSAEPALDSAAYRLLHRWVRSVPRQRVPSPTLPPESTNLETPFKTSQSPTERLRPLPQGRTAGAVSQPTDADRSPSSESASVEEQAVPEASLEDDPMSGSGAVFQPQDPFDPEIFNRQLIGENPD
jgi:hypothetical protein